MSIDEHEHCVNHIVQVAFKMQLLIRGVVTTTSMTHQTFPVNDNSRKGIAQQATTDILAQNIVVRGVPFISAESVRGLIRRAAGDVVFDILKAKKQKISRNLYLSLVRGAFSRRGLESGGATIDQLIRSYSHTFAGLFGGGAWMLRSAFRMEKDLLPILQSTIDLFPACVRAHAVDVRPADLLTLKVMAPRDDFARLPRQAQENVENLDAAYTEHMSTKVQQSAAKKEDASESKDDLDNFGMVECIIPGTPLYFGVRGDHLTEAQAGLLVTAVFLWCIRNGLGGGNARGRGTFAPSLSLEIDGKLVTSQLVIGDAPDLKLSDDPVVKLLVDAMKAALEVEAASESLNAVYPTEIRSKTDKPAKKGKKGETSPEEDHAAEA